MHKSEYKNLKVGEIIINTDDGTVVKIKSISDDYFILYVILTPNPFYRDEDVPYRLSRRGTYASKWNKL